MFIQAITVQSSVLCLAMASSTSSSIVVRARRAYTQFILQTSLSASLASTVPVREKL